MAQQHTNLPDRVAAELAELTGRTDAEMKLVLGIGAVVTGVTAIVTLAYRTFAFVVDVDLFDR